MLFAVNGDLMVNINNKREQIDELKEFIRERRARLDKLERDKYAYIVTVNQDSWRQRKGKFISGACDSGLSEDKEFREYRQKERYWKSEIKEAEASIIQLKKHVQLLKRLYDENSIEEILIITNTYWDSVTISIASAQEGKRSVFSYGLPVAFCDEDMISMDPEEMILSVPFGFTNENKRIVDTTWQTGYKMPGDCYTEKDRTLAISNIKELEEALREEHLLSVNSYGRQMEYVDGSSVYYDGEFHNKPYSFGIYKEEDKYISFLTDSHEGKVIKYLTYDNESDACKAVYHRAKRLKTMDTAGTIRDFIISKYKASEEQAAKDIMRLFEHKDITKEFVDVINGESITDNGIKVHGYTAKRMMEKCSLNELAAYKQLINLRENPQRALYLLNQVELGSLSKQCLDESDKHLV